MLLINCGYLMGPTSSPVSRK